MVRSALSKVAWVGRTASMVFGLALVMALVFGVASMALGANGQNFILGKLNNAATRVTGLVGNVNGAALRVTNPNAGTNDTALDLRVQAGEAPMRVNSTARVANLNAATAGRADSAANADNADKLDGKDSGAYLPGDLPSATTVRGSFYLMNHASASGQYFGEGLSFGYRLPSAPVGHYIKKGQVVPAGCFGNADNPGALPGHLCLFESGSRYASSSGVDSLKRSGGGVWMRSSVAGHTYVIGTWAVTAP